MGIAFAEAVCLEWIAYERLQNPNHFALIWDNFEAFFQI